MVQTSDETAPQSLLAPSVRDENRKNKPAEESNEMVTLTKTQLRAILEALSQVGQSNDSKPEQQPEINKLQDKNINGKSTSDAKRQYTGRYGPHTRNCSSHEEIVIDSEFVPNGKIDLVHTPLMSQAASNTKAAGISRLERKRQQWAKERAEMEEWNPWGKPGAGAPRLRRSSTSSTFPRVESRAMLVHSPSNSSYPTRSSLSSPLQAYHSPCVTPDESPSPHLTTFSQSVTKPSRSVFSFPQDIVDNTEETKTQWLERQREEERQRCLLEHDRLHLSRQLNAALMAEQKAENGSSSICPTLDSRTSTVEGKIFLRGQGLVAEPEDVAKALERRQKAIEYQREVQQQMEEKKSKEREEKQRKILEEQEEEKRLEAERIRMQKEYEEEQHRQKEKEELDERKRKVLIAAMEQAQAAAEAARKATKAQRFQSCPELSFSQTKTPNNEEAISQAEDKERAVDEEEKPKEISRLDQRTATVHPVQNNPPSESKQQREFAVQTSLVSESSGYIENRVLTPTVVRMKEKARSQHKEFGTQTDFRFVDRWLADDTYSPVSTSSSLTSIESYRKNRIQHSLPTKASQNNYDSSFNQQKWGVSAPQKPYIKMSERDPHYHKRKRLLELRKQHWEREVASQRAFTETRRSIFSSQSTNKPLIRKKKVISSSEGSLSSSEGEEKYDHQENIHSLPCFLKRCHYQHIRGSADDVTGKAGYESNNRDYHSDSHSSAMQRGRLAQSTENLLSYPFSESLHSRTSCQNFTFPSRQSHHPSMRRKWHSQETFLPQSPGIFSVGCTSPPVPAVQKRLGEQQDDCYHVPRRKWTDQEGYSPEDIPPSSAQCTSSSPFDGNENNDGRKPDTDPLVHPEIVTRRPTARQDKILMQLSSLRQGLLLKQRELESQLLRPACETS